MKFKIIQNQQTPKINGIDPYGELFVVNSIFTEQQKLLSKFLHFARERKNCVGLAANQVSCDGERIMLPFFAIKLNHVWDIVISPYIIKYSGKKEQKIEGCLTWIGREIIADRYPEIKVSYYNLKGERIQRTITGLEAQIWQHEYNHLQGIEESVSPKSTVK